MLIQVELENDEENAKLHCPKAQRSDTGKYKVKLSNKYGDDEGEIKVIVLGKHPLW